MIVLALSCSEMKNNTETKKNILTNQVEYEDKINSKIYYESDAYKMILFAMKKDQTLKPHSAPMDTPLLMLEGEATINIDKNTYVLNEGESIILPKNIDHAVSPISDIKFVLIK